jgi:hypothetical protein
LADRKNYPLRLDPEVYEALRVWAGDELRSVNAQIEFLLVRALRQEGRAPRRSAQVPPPPAQDSPDE